MLPWTNKIFLSDLKKEGGFFIKSELRNDSLTEYKINEMYIIKFLRWQLNMHHCIYLCVLIKSLSRY